MKKKRIIALTGIAALATGIGVAASMVESSAGFGRAEAGGPGWLGDHGGRHGGWGRGGPKGPAGMFGFGGIGGMLGAGPLARLCPSILPARATVEAALRADGFSWDSTATQRDACFAHFDTDKDGTISAAEIDTLVANRSAALKNRALAMADRDFDGSITRDEITGGWFGGWRHWFGGGRRVEASRDQAAGQPSAAGQPPTDPSTTQREPGQQPPAPSADAAGEDMMADLPMRGHGRRGHRGRPMAAMFDRADSDKDGTVSEAELNTFTRLLVEDGKRHVLARLDADKSGSVTRVEFDKPMRDVFAIGDLDGNGRITRDELPLMLQWRLEQ